LADTAAGIAASESNHPQYILNEVAKLEAQATLAAQRLACIEAWHGENLLKTLLPFSPPPLPQVVDASLTQTPLRKTYLRQFGSWGTRSARERLLREKSCKDNKASGQERGAGTVTYSRQPRPQTRQRRSAGQALESKARKPQ